MASKWWAWLSKPEPKPRPAVGDLDADRHECDDPNTCPACAAQDRYYYDYSPPLNIPAGYRERS